MDLHRPELMLWVPEGFAHGFYVKSDRAHVCYKTTEYYYKEHGRVLLWNDPELDIEWETTTPILSGQDRRGKTLEECDKYE